MKEIFVGMISAVVVYGSVGTLTFYRAFFAHHVWNWYMPGIFALPVLSWPQMVALMLVWAVAFDRIDLSKTDDKIDYAHFWSTILGVPVFLFALAYGLKEWFL